jgi:glutathione S-transferase
MDELDNGQMTIYGWPSSPYSVKVLAFLRHCGTPHHLIVPSWSDFRKTLVPAIGYVVIPVVIHRELGVLQDSAEIIDALEAAIQPELPCRSLSEIERFSDAAIELVADELFICSSMHFRWNTRANRSFIEADFGKSIAPSFPKFLQRASGRLIARRMRAHLRRLGIVPPSTEAIVRFTETWLTTIDKVTKDQPFLFGESPSRADFSFAGQIYAHLFRDLGTRHLLQDYPHLLSWLDRTIFPRIRYEKSKRVYHEALGLTLRQSLVMVDSMVGNILARLHFAEGKALPLHVGPVPFPLQPEVTCLGRTALLHRYARCRDRATAMSAREMSESESWLGLSPLSGLLSHRLPKIGRRHFRLICL